MKSTTEDGRSKPRLRPINRDQLMLRPVEVEKLVPEDHEVRGIWEFVGRLDLSPYYGEIEAVQGEAGRPAWDPQLMISLWVYGYSKGISSGREICRPLASGGSNRFGGGVCPHDCDDIALPIDLRSERQFAEWSTIRFGIHEPSPPGSGGEQAVFFVSRSVKEAAPVPAWHSVPFAHRIARHRATA